MEQSTLMSNEKTSWHQEPLMILVVGLPILSVIVGSIILYFALTGKDTLVSDSYYKDGMSYTEDRLFDKNAKAHQITATLTIMDKIINVEVDAQLEQTPEALLLQLIHPTLSSRDINLMLIRTGEKNYTAEKELELPARWKLWLSSQSKQWRVRYNGEVESQKPITLKPN